MIIRAVDHTPKLPNDRAKGRDDSSQHFSSSTMKEQINPEGMNIAIESYQEAPYSEEAVMGDTQVNPTEDGVHYESSDSLVGNQPCDGYAKIAPMVNQSRHHKIAKLERKARMQRRRFKRKSTSKHKKTPCSRSNIVIGYKSPVGMKRKDAPAIDYFHRPRKKFPSSSCVGSMSPSLHVMSGSNIESRSSVVCHNNCSFSSSLTHEMVTDHY